MNAKFLLIHKNLISQSHPYSDIVKNVIVIVQR